MPHSAPPAQPPLGVGSVAPRPKTAAAIAPAAPAASIAPASPRPATAPVYAGGPGPTPPRSSPRPQIAVVDDPSLSLPMPARRPWGLIFVVLIADLGLAVSGAWMLAQGLR